MQALIKNKGILAIVALFIIAMFVYNIFYKSDQSSTVSELSASDIGNELLKTRETLQKVTFDQSVFSSQGYLELTDFSVEIPSQAVGRPNPFNTIGRD